MADQSQPGSTDGARSSTSSDLDDALAQAAALAADLALALGEAPLPSAPERSDAPAVDAASLDAELSKLEDLVEEAATEVGPQESESSGGASDMMAEFVDPPGESGGETAAGDAPVAAEQGAESDLAEAAQTGVVGTGMLGVVGNIKKPTPIMPPGTLQGGPEAVAKASDGGGAAATTPMSRVKTLVAQRLGPPLYALSERAVGVLEKVDAPFGRISGKVRELIGWVALATIATSILVLLIASF